MMTIPNRRRPRVANANDPRDPNKQYMFASRRTPETCDTHIYSNRANEGQRRATTVAPAAAYKRLVILILKGIDAVL